METRYTPPSLEVTVPGEGAKLDSKFSKNTVHFAADMDAAGGLGVSNKGLIFSPNNKQLYPFSKMPSEMPSGAYLQYVRGFPLTGVSWRKAYPTAHSHALLRAPDYYLSGIDSPLSQIDPVAMTPIHYHASPSVFSTPYLSVSQQRTRSKFKRVRIWS